MVVLLLLLLQPEWGRTSCNCTLKLSRASRQTVRHAADLLSLRACAQAHSPYSVHTHIHTQVLCAGPCMADHPPLKSSRALLGTAAGTQTTCYKDFVWERTSEEFLRV